MISEVNVANTDTKKKFSTSETKMKKGENTKNTLLILFFNCMLAGVSQSTVNTGNMVQINYSPCNQNHKKITCNCFHFIHDYHNRFE